MKHSPASAQKRSETFARKATNRVEDIEWLIKNQVTAHEIAGRLGSSATDQGLKSLSTSMRRHGRPDLANWLERARFSNHYHSLDDRP